MSTFVNRPAEPAATGPALEHPILVQSAPRRTLLESFSYDDAIVRMFLLATLVWGLVAMAAGLFIALELAFPALNANVPYLSFGRLRPLHTNAAIFAFAGNSIFAAIYYSTQRLCKARMYSDLLSRLHFWGWQAIIVSAALTLPLGVTQGKEYAELEWPIDLAIAVVWVGFFAVNFFGTLARRRERHMYVALWFYIATIVTVALLHIFNNLSLPLAVSQLLHGEMPTRAGLLKSWPWYAGVQDALIQWWYGHNAVAFFLTTPFLGLMYYFMPKAAERPVYSYRLSIVHFWSLVFIYIWAGPHHLHYTALPAWASTLGMLFSLMLWMPSWGGMINGLLTLRGAWHKVTTDPVLKFFVVGVTFYGMSTFEGPMLSIKSVNALSHYTDWTIAHVHGGALGWNGFLTFGMMYWLLPRLFQTKLWSTKLATAHFWVGTLGILLYVVSIYWAGITQGLMWRAFDATGHLKFPDFVETVAALNPFYWGRAVGGTLYLLGAAFAGVNFYKTWRTRPAVYDVPVYQAAPLSATRPHDETATSRLSNVIEFGHRADQFIQGAWHRRWERLPLKFTAFTVVAVSIGGLVEALPTFLIKSNVPTIASVKPYTPLELAGRDIYVAEGCYNCHSQMIRPIYAETKRYGEYSKPGEFVYDHPFQWGSRRIGPDLAREGITNPSPMWHFQHFNNPRDLKQQSIMPRYGWLLRQKTDFATIGDRVRAMAMLGVPYGEAVKPGKAEAMAREQARAVAAEIERQGGPPGMEETKVVALIAYLQRLGTDISKPAEAAPAGAPAAPAAPGAPRAGEDTRGAAHAAAR